MQELADAGAAVKTAEAEARHARAELERCQEADRKRAALLGEAETARKAAEQHRLVATALGPDGVQSLLLEASAPAIADAANDLLDKAYGSRWRLRIDLQRASSDGKRQIEDVRLLVRDTTSTASFSDDLEPGEQPIETLSGGESVWIRAALAAAIGQIRAERTGVEWRTVLMDEADAGLDEGPHRAIGGWWRRRTRRPAGITRWRSRTAVRSTGSRSASRWEARCEVEAWQQAATEGDAGPRCPRRSTRAT